MGGGYRNVGSGGRYGGGYDSGQYGDGGGFGPGMGQRGFRSYGMRFEFTHSIQLVLTQKLKWNFNIDVKLSEFVF